MNELEVLISNLETINHLAEILYDLLRDNPREQTLAKIISEYSSVDNIYTTR